MERQMFCVNKGEVINNEKIFWSFVFSYGHGVHYVQFSMTRGKTNMTQYFRKYNNIGFEN